MLPTRFSLRNPVAVTLFYVLVGLLGTFAFARMGRSILPPVAFPVVAIAAPYPGAAPGEIERLVLMPIEDRLDAVPQVDRVFATAQEGLGSIQVRFRFGSNLDGDRINVQQAVDAARPNMPADLVPPAVLDADPSQAPIFEASVSSAVLSPRALTEIVDNRISPALRATAGAGTVRISGEVTPQLTIEPRTGALYELGGTPLDLLRAVQSANDIFPGGRLRSALSESTVGVRSSADTVTSLALLPVGLPGGSVRVNDVADVRDGYQDPDELVNVDGAPAIVLSVGRAPGADSLRTIAAINRTIDRLAARFPLVRFTPLRSDAPSTVQATDGVFQTIAEGVALTVLVTLFFLRVWRSALIAAIAIPTSLCAALVAMWAAGFTIDVLSLMGLSLTIGILVDDSIVILEAIESNARLGLVGDDAAVAGRNELGSAAFAITLVDVAVFAPIAFMGGVVGEFMREFGLTIVFATSFSLLVSFTLTPLLAARWRFRKHGARRTAILPWMLRTKTARTLATDARRTIETLWRWEVQLAEAYAHRWLPAAWNRRRLIVAAAIAGCAGALALLASGRIATEFSPPVSDGRASVSLTFPPGTPLVRTLARAQRFAQRLLDEQGVRHVVVTSGRAFNGVTDVFAGNVAQIDAMLDDASASGNAVTDRIRAMQPLAPEATVAGAGRGMGGTAPVSYTIAGEPGAIDAAAALLATGLRANPYAADVRSSDAGVGPRLDVAIDPAKAMLLGVSADDAAHTARIATGGEIAAKVRTPLGITNVVVRAKSGDDLEGALRLPVRSSGSGLVPLADVATIAQRTEPRIIERENGERVVTVTANTQGSAPIGLVTGPISRKLRDPNFLPSGSHVEARGDVEQFLDTVTKIGTTLALSVVIVYAILAVLYRSYTLPLAIMLSVPLASIGALGALFLTSQPLNLYSMLGIVMLVGLVAKNGILLVEYAEREVRRGTAVRGAMLAAARRRFRPIVMTTAAMVAGMLPLALGDTIGAQYRQALGIVVIGGLSSSLLLTLFVVPIAYIAYRRNPRGAPVITLDVPIGAPSIGRGRLSPK